MKRLLFFLVLALPLAAAERITFKRIQLQDKFYAEGAHAADINKDGKMDIISGPFWYEGPDWQKKHAFYEPKEFSINGYSDNFFVYPHDFNADGWPDILVLGFPGKEARLYLNPGSFTSDTPWPMHIVADVVDNESPVFTDITGDGKPEIVCSTGGKFGYFAPNWAKPTEKWPFVAVTDDLKVAKFTHGLGVGDVNGDGKMDLLEARRWWENTGITVGANNGPEVPASFIQHNFAAGVGGGAQMFAYDFDGNGANDVFTSLQAHRYGVAVFLQNKPLKLEGNNTYKGTAVVEKSPTPVGPNWNRVMLASEQPQDNDYGIVFSQPHAAFLADINGDGVQDIVTGKRYWAHNGHDPDERGARVVYWYETKRDGQGGVDFIPHLADAESGVGVDVQVVDVNGDKWSDIVIGNKAGVYVLLQERTTISDEKAELLTPKKLYGPALKLQKDYAHGQSAQDALKAMQLPGGFKAELIAAEPDLVQPIAFTFDERGRIWVVEGNSYPKPREVGAGQDRIKILEDKDGDGTFETKKIFCEGINLASGIELGFGGVWVGAAPYLMFIPDRDKDDKPDAPEMGLLGKAIPKVPGLSFQAHALLDGWGAQDTHETLNSFIWGPDGWLYGCHGVFTHSKVGKPGTPDEQRQPINAGIWRYHPVRHEFEIFAHGTSNPWGLDYDQHGEFFVTSCVIPHLYHIVPGGRYQRQAGQHFNAYTYEDIKTIADHAHYAGNPRPDVSQDKTTGAGIVNNDTNALGGGHAHCGLAIYQSSLFPPTYRNQLLFGNLHGHRLVANYTDPHASSYIGKHAADFLRANDMHFIPVTQKVGPDGALYVSDWSDQQICHRGSNAVENWDRSNGRIYRISYDGWKPWKGDLAKESDEALAKLAVQTENEWESRMARRVYAERSTSDTLEDDFTQRMKFRQELESKASPTAMLKIKWLYEAFYDGSWTRAISNPSKDEALRSWGWRQATTPRFGKEGYVPTHIALGNGPNPEAFFNAAKNETSPVVRRSMASALQRFYEADQVKDCAPYQTALAKGLLAHGEDKDDPMIPLLIWYGIEPLVAADPAAGMQLAAVSKMPKVTEFIFRRLSAEDAGRQKLLRLAAESKDVTRSAQMIAMVAASASAAGRTTLPDDWAALAAKFPQNLPRSALFDLWELEAINGMTDARNNFRHIAFHASKEEDDAARQRALRVLLRVGDATSLTDLLSSATSAEYPPHLRRLIIQGLAIFPNREEAEKKSQLRFDWVLRDVIERRHSEAEVLDAVNALTSWPTGAKTLLEAIRDKKVLATALSPFLVRQLTAFDDAEINALIKTAWGDVNAPKADLGERTKKYRDLLTPAALVKGDLAKGKMLFLATCGACHKLLGEGQNVGPDITGSNRADLNYLLENVLDPNAVIGKAYQLNLFTMKDGRVMSGVIKDESPAAVKIAMMGGIEFTLPVADIAKREVSKLSTMPEGLFDALPPEQVIDLVKYLQSGASAPAAGKVAGALEGEALQILETTGGNTRVQGMGGFGGTWSNGQQLWWTGGTIGSKLTLALPVPEKGQFTLRAVLTKARDYGITDVALDGKPVAIALDCYHPDQVILTDELDWGTHELTAGEHQLTLTVTGKNANAAPGHMVGLDYVRLEKK